MIKIGFKKHHLYEAWFAMAFLLAHLGYGQTPPTFTSTPVLAVTYGSVYTYSITTSDVENDARQILLTSGPLPIGLSLTDNGDGTAQLSGTVLETGNFPIELTVVETIDISKKEVQTFTITVAKATATIVLSNLNPIYDGTPKSPTITTTPGGLLVDVTYNGVGIQPSSAGSYSIIATINDINFSGTEVGTLVIGKAPLTAKADDQSRQYGLANPTLTISYTGFLNSDSPSSITVPSISTSATNLNNVGTYPITLTGGTATNYSISLQNGTLTVTKAALTAKADDQSRQYGLANPALTISYTGFLNSDSPSSITVPSISTSASILSDVGTYPISLAGGAAVNYTITVQGGTLTVTKAALTAKADDQSRQYGLANPALTISYTGFLNSDSPSSITVPSISTSATNLSNVGTYPITLTGGAATNYSLSLQNGTLTVTKAALTAKADDQSRQYGLVNPTLTITYTGFVNGENASVISTPSASTIASTTSNVGTYPITLTGGAATNYSITLLSGILTITKSSLIARAVDQSRLYGQANPTFTISYTGFLNSDNVASITPPTASTAATVASNVGSYPITVSGGTASNYNFIYQNGTLTISKVTPLVTWSNPSPIIYGTALTVTQLNATASVPGNFSYAPGSGTILNVGVNQALSVNFTPTDITNYNVVNGTQVFITVNKATPAVTWSNPADIVYGTPLSSTQLNASSSIAGIFSYTPSSGTVLNAGNNQVLSVNFVPTDVANYNSVSSVTVQINVTKANPVITWANPLAIVYGTSLSGTQLNATSSVAGSLVYTPSIGTVLNAGANQVLSVSFTPTDMANYNIANKTVQLTVNKANPIIIWANPAPITYGTQLTSTQLSATASVSGVLTYTPLAGTVLNAGANQILSVNFTPIDAANYNSITNLQRLITVNKATPVISWPTPLPIKVGVALSATQLNATSTVPGSFTYTPASGTILGTGANQILSTDFIPTDAANYNSVVGTQVLITVNLKDNPIITWPNPAPITYGTALSALQLNATSNVPGSFSYSPAVGTILNSGANQVLSTTFTPTDAVTYNSIVSTVLINVNKASLTATAVDASRSYGQTNPTFIINYTGFVYGDLSTVIDTRPTASCTAVASSTAGSSFPITLTGGVDNNYTFNYVNGSLTIVKATLIAKPDDKSRSYGLTNPLFTISYTGFVNGDNVSVIAPPSATTTALQTSNVGLYPINLAGGTSTNYNFTLQSGSLTINPSPLTAKADDKTKNYGQSNPTLTISYSGFLNTDNAASITEPTITTTATASTGAGTVPITLSGGSALNYSILLQSGTLTISKATLTIKADDKSRIYGQANPVNSITYTGFVNGENSSFITPPTISGPSATALSSVGNYPISLSGGLAANYTLNLQPGTLSVTKAMLQAIADNKQRVYGQANPSLTITYSGFVNGENASAIASLPQATTSASSNSSVGNYSITVSGGLANNYDFSYVSGVFTITKALLTAKADDKSRLYGQANPALTISLSGFVNGDNQSALSVQPIATTVATPSSSVGSYIITVSGGSAANYDLGYVNGTLLIGKSTLTATADDINRLFGTVGPPLTISYSGFANGDTPIVLDTPPVASTTATISSPIGAYPITVADGIDNNYNFTYVSGTLTITSTVQPTIKNFSISTNEDVSFTFNYNSFFQNFVSVPGDNIVQVKIVTLPTKGSLTSLGANVAIGDLIKVKNGVLDELKYIPNLNYNGIDNFKWNVSNGTVSAVSDAQVNIAISPINDPPVLDNIETKELLYSLGDPAILITKQLVLNDVDDSFMYSALISISEKHSGGDVLSWDKTISTKITSTFDNTTGQLRLKGKDSKSNYEKALNSVLFSSPVSSDTTLSRKKVTFVVNDSIDNSNIVFRKIQAETFPDLNIVSAFTPNNDGPNDYWDFMNLNAYQVIAISIFDRNGVKVFECSTGDCKWDGKSGGKELPSGPYFYTIDLNNGKRKYQGVVTILK